MFFLIALIAAALAWFVGWGLFARTGLPSRDILYADVGSTFPQPAPLTQDFAYGHARDPHHPRDLAFANLLRIQFQNRGALRLAQHAVSSPVGFLHRCDGVAFECARSGAARLRIAGDPDLSPLRQPAAAAHG